MSKKSIELSKCAIFFYVITCKRKSDLKEICAEKIYFKFFKNKLAKLISSDIEKNLLKTFFSYQQQLLRYRRRGY